MSTSKKGILTALSESNQYITIGVELAGVFVPLIKGLVKDIRQIGAGSAGVAYEVLVQTDIGELDQVHKLAEDDLAAINAELTRLGKPTI